MFDIVNVVAVYISRQFTGKLKTNTAEGEVIEENQELVSSILIDALEDIGLSRAIEEGEKSQSIIKSI